MPKTRARLGDVLVASGAISAEQLRHTLATQRDSKGRRRKLGAVAIESGFATEENVAKGLARQLGLPFLDLRTTAPDPQAVQLIPKVLAYRRHLIGVHRDADGVTVAMADPTDVVALDDIRVTLSKWSVKIVVGTRTAILDAANRLYGMELAAVDLLDPLEALGDAQIVSESIPVKALERSATSGPIVRLVNSILTDAVRSRATDIHIEPQPDMLKVRYRIDGLLREVIELPKHAQPLVLSRIKIMAGMDISERRAPQDGRATVVVDKQSIDARMASIPTFSGEKIVIRLLPSQPQTVSLGSLGLEPEQQAVVEAQLARPQGLVVFTGPTGAGKTSTMYAALAHLTSPEKNTITLEDPIEYQVPGLNQVQIDERAAITFAGGLRSVLRLDPDVIMVGEIRDFETAQIVLQAALSGHLVLTSLHTNDASSAVTRLVDLGVEPFLIASGLSMVVASAWCARPVGSAQSRKDHRHMRWRRWVLSTRTLKTRSSPAAQGARPAASPDTEGGPASTRCFPSRTMYGCR